jgi:GNAT superfamily N-acetyltransferase
VVGSSTHNQYQIGLLVLYTIKPDQFPEVNKKPEINIQPVTKDNLESYLIFQFEKDLRFGKEYAEQKQGQHERNFHNENILQVLAYYKGVPAGSLDVIISSDYIEIDGFFVLEAFQKRGIGSSIQKFVMDQFHDKTVMLVANGEDTARVMYRRQNYQYLGFRYEVMKVYKI